MKGTTMRWECSECGALLETARAPRVCMECGLASGKFVLAEPNPDDDEPIAAWLRAGVEGEILALRVPR